MTRLRIEGTGLAHDVTLGEDVEIWKPVNLWGCTIGAGTRIAAFVEIQRDAVIGERCNIGTGAFIAAETTIGDGCFIGQGVRICNCREPRATAWPGGPLKEGHQWKCEPVIIEAGASIGANATVLPGVHIGIEAMVGAGAVVTRDVAHCATVVGNPARQVS